jgi:hypothetical protein
VTILVLVIGGNLYALNQFLALTELVAESAIFQAVDTEKQLLISLYVQLESGEMSDNDCRTN